MSVIVSTEWLEKRLNDPDVVPLDCRVERVIHPEGPSSWEDCRHLWEKLRIPGSGYVHFVKDLSDPDTLLPFTLASAARIGAVLSRFGIKKRTCVVVYGACGEVAVHRAWWSLVASGHADVRVLDGGLRKWQVEGRQLASGPASFLATQYMPSPNGECIATRSDAEGAMNNPSECLINALSPELFRGEGNQVFGRPGHIPDSVNIPSESLIDEETGCFLPPEQLAAIFEARLPTECQRLIPYCGGGVAASTVALALAIVGRNNVTLYDGSLFDWTQNPAAPMATGEA